MSMVIIGIIIFIIVLLIIYYALRDSDKGKDKGSDENIQKEEGGKPSIDDYILGADLDNVKKNFYDNIM